MILAVALVAGALIGPSLGALGSGSVLAVPVLVYGLGQSAAQATTGSLLVVGITSLAGAVTAYRSGNVLLTRGFAFGAVAIGGATAGAKASGLVATHPTTPNPRGETIMCRAVTCKKCGKTTWAGCGQHVNQVMSGVPASQRCEGHANDPAAAGGGWLRRLFGRG